MGPLPAPAISIEIAPATHSNDREAVRASQWSWLADGRQNDRNADRAYLSVGKRAAGRAWNPARTVTGQVKLRHIPHAIFATRL